MSLISIRQDDHESNEEDRFDPLYPNERSTELTTSSPIMPEPRSISSRKNRDEFVSNSNGRPQLKMTQAAYRSLMEDLAYKKFSREEGGILFGPNDADDLVVQYVKDVHGESRVASFTIDSEHLNQQIRRVKPAGLTCVGIVHSHPNGICRPSYGDIEFLRTIFSNPKNGGGQFLFPIVCNQRLYPFVVDTNDVSRILAAELVLV